MKTETYKNTKREGFFNLYLGVLNFSYFQSDGRQNMTYWVNDL